MFFDAGNGGADQPAHRIDGRKPRGRFGPAAQTWPESCAFRRCRTGIEVHVLALGRARRTNGPAVDMRGGNGHEKSAVEAVVAGAHCAKTSVGGEFPGGRIAKSAGEYSPFSDLDSRANLRPPHEPDTKLRVML